MLVLPFLVGFMLHTHLVCEGPARASGTMGLPRWKWKVGMKEKTREHKNYYARLDIIHLIIQPEC